MIKEIKHIPTLISCCHIHFIIAFTWHKYDTEVFAHNF